MISKMYSEQEVPPERIVDEVQGREKVTTAAKPKVEAVFQGWEDNFKKAFTIWNPQKE